MRSATVGEGLDGSVFQVACGVERNDFATMSAYSLAERLGNDVFLFLGSKSLPYLIELVGDTKLPPRALKRGFQELSGCFYSPQRGASLNNNSAQQTGSVKHHQKQLEFCRVPL